MSSARSKRKRRQDASAPEEQSSQAATESEETVAPHEASDADTASAEPAEPVEAASSSEEGEARASTEAAPASVPDTDVTEAAAAGEGGEPGEPGEPDDEVALSAGPDGEPSRADLKRWLESLIFVADKPVTAQQLARTVKTRLANARELLEELVEEYEPRGIQLVELASGYQFRSSPSSAHVVRDAVAAPPVRLTRAQLETLALVAYRQPITRPEVDEVRGVDSGSALRVLLERGLLKMLGRKDEPGRPLLYGTAPYFLEFFGMRSLKDLPTLREFTELSDENRALFKRKTGESVEDAEAALLSAEERAERDEQAIKESSAEAETAAPAAGESEGASAVEAEGEAAAGEAAAAEVEAEAPAEVEAEAPAEVEVAAEGEPEAAETHDPVEESGGTPHEEPIDDAGPHDLQAEGRDEVGAEVEGEAGESSAEDDIAVQLEE